MRRLPGDSPQLRTACIWSLVHRNDGRGAEKDCTAAAPRRKGAQTLALMTRSYAATMPIVQSLQSRSRFALSLDSLAFSLAAASSSGTSTALPKYTSSGVRPP